MLRANILNSNTADIQVWSDDLEYFAMCGVDFGVLICQGFCSCTEVAKQTEPVGAGRHWMHAQTQLADKGAPLQAARTMKNITSCREHCAQAPRLRDQ
eukprot:2106670-Amphidinium_carterae.1